MQVNKTRLQGVKLIDPDVYGDHRGFFMESYNLNQYAAQGIDHIFIQDNHSLSKEIGVLRGLHYQLYPKAQTKLVRVVAGEIYDVVLDIRRGSPTFGQWESFILSADNKKQLLVPKGFAHGFCTTKPNTEVLYKVDELYSPELDRGVLWNDPVLGIEWPNIKPILSNKDKQHPNLANADINFDYEEPYLS